MTIVSISPSVSDRSFDQTWFSESPLHGGMSRFSTARAIERAHGRASLYVINDIGATSPVRWHCTQLLKKIGATSRV